MAYINPRMLRMAAGTLHAPRIHTRDELEDAQLRAERLLESGGHTFKSGATEEIINYFAEYMLGKTAAEKRFQDWSALARSGNLDAQRRSAPSRRASEPRKGLLLAGTVGTGKTTILWTASAAWQIEYLTAPEMMILYAEEGLGDVIEATCGGRMMMRDLIIDDLGAESEMKSYGVPLDMGLILQRRYDLWRLHGARLFVATNLTGKELSDRYGERTVDRLREMCQAVTLTGPSFRKVAVK